MTRILELTHFGKGKKPKRLTIDEEGPTINDKNYPVEGSFIIAIDDGKNRLAFKLTEAEASLIAIRLEEVVRIHSKEFMNESVRAEVMRRKEKGEE
jgi:hypothetical protein